MKYIHIGFPKNFSTSLQRSFFPVHPQLLHLGVGSKDNNLGYHDPEVETALELYLKSCRLPKYLENKERIKRHFDQLFAWGQQRPEIKATGISCEHLSFAFTMDGLDYMEKAKRLFELFGKDTRIIMIVRNQRDLLRSLYCECLRQGLPMTYAQFMMFVYKYQDRNFFYDFCFSEVAEAYAQLFGKENVGIFFFENYRTSTDSGERTLTDRSIISDLCMFLGIDLLENAGIGHFNQALNDHELQSIYEYNQHERHNLGNCLYESAEFHRARHYFMEELKLNEPEPVFFRDVLAKRKAVAHAMASPAAQPISFEADPRITDYIMTRYRQSNEKLKHYSNDVPEIYLA